MSACEPLLSILIPTLESRRAAFEALCDDLNAQARRAGAEAAVEVLHERDAGAARVGAKRNRLVERARGRFIAFVDDDDRVSPDYVASVCGALDGASDVDVVGLTGEVTFRGRHPRRFVYSLQYSDYATVEGVYTRPPHHLNPVRRAIVQRFRFLEVNRSEDAEWALRLQRERVLRREVLIPDVLYYYRSRRWWPYQWLLDKTETPRHALGLRMVNRFALRPR